MPADVIVDDRRVLTRLVERPQIGAGHDVGDSILVTQKDVARGGLIAAARRAGNAAAD